MKCLFACVLMLPALSGAQTLKGSCANLFEAPLSPGQHVSMRLRAGDVEVVGVSRPGLRVTCSTGDHPSEAVKITFAAGTLRTYGGPSNSVRFRIEVPARTDLVVRLTAGDMDLSGIIGDKDVQVRAGDVTISVDKPDDYRVAEASVMAGDLRATAFGVTKDGLFRSFHKTNPDGTYRLHAELMAGDLTLGAQASSRRKP